MKHVISLFLLAVISLSACQSNSNPQATAQKATTATESERIKRIAVQFDGNGKGTQVARQNGTIKGDEIVDYVFSLKQGQYLNVSLASKHSGTYFNILPPSNETAIFVGSMQGGQFESTVSATGEYRVRVYQMRASARRGETADFGLEIIVGEAK